LRIRGRKDGAMGSLAEIRKKTVETGSHWIVERIYAEGRNQLLVVEGFDQEKSRSNEWVS
jgi:hypothetical protein